MKRIGRHRSMIAAVAVVGMAAAAGCRRRLKRAVGHRSGRRVRNGTGRSHRPAARGDRNLGRASGCTEMDIAAG